MQAETFQFQSPDSVEIFTYAWLPDEGAEIKAAIQIAHGMAEHAARYERFAEVLVEAGYAVYANDHRGHGRTAGDLENVGYFADKNGFDLVVGDMFQLTGLIKERHPEKPVFLFGHSMGSVLSRAYIFDHGRQVDGVILSGTVGDPGALGKVGVLVAKSIGLTKGRRHPSPMMAKMSFGEFNKPFRPNRTDFDWLTRDEAEVDKYVADPYCGGVFSTGFWVDFLSGMKAMFDPARLSLIPKDLPIYIFSGSKDPCGGFTKGVQQVYDAYQKAGLANVGLKFYEDGRHEMLNETNRDEVFADVLAWLSDRG